MDPQQLLQHQAQQQQFHEQLQILNQKINEQETRLHQIQNTRFNLTPDQIIRNFNEITSFSGDNNYKLKSFLKSVEDVESLCGMNNEDLKQYCLKKLINNKIIGSARNAILEIPDHQRTWTNIIAQLQLKFKPKSTIHQLLFTAKELKVNNLKELFEKLNEIKSKCSEICDFEDEENFTYEAIDKELVQIIKSKLIPIMQIQINSEKTLFELDNILCQSEIYYCNDIIKNEYKINKSYNSGNNNHNKNYNNNKQKPNYQSQNYLNKNNIGQNQNFNSYRQNNFNNKHPNQNSNNNYRNNYNGNNYNGQNYNGQYRQNSGQYRQNSGQFRANNYGNNNFNKNREITPMEVDNLEQTNSQINHINNEVNFTDVTPQTSYR